MNYVKKDVGLMLSQRIFKVDMSQMHNSDII